MQTNLQPYWPFKKLWPSPTRAKTLTRGLLATPEWGELYSNPLCGKSLILLFSCVSYSLLPKGPMISCLARIFLLYPSKKQCPTFSLWSHHVFWQLQEWERDVQQQDRNCSGLSQCPMFNGAERALCFKSKSHMKWYNSVKYCFGNSCFCLVNLQQRN